MKQLIKNKKGLQLSHMIIGMLVIIGIMMGYFYWITDAVNQYGIAQPSGANDSFYKINNTVSQIDTLLVNTSTELNQINSRNNNNIALDFISFFFDAGYRAAKVATLSIGSMNVFVDVAVDTAIPGTYGSLVKNLLLLGIIVIFVIGILMAFIIKSGRE